MIDGARILITGGTGSLGTRLTQRLLEERQPYRIILMARGEENMRLAKERFKGYGDKVDYFIGDVESLERCREAFVGCDIIVHAAAMKQIPMCEDHPFEAVETNVIGAKNVCKAAIENKVTKTVFISTDKAVSPANLYGATKLAGEKIALGANVYGGGWSSFSCVRYGNVAGSRGSVIPFFRSLIKKGERTLPITDSRMTRFWLSIDEAVDAVVTTIEAGIPESIYIPKMPSFKITDLACAMGDRWEQKGMRAGEKLHESMLGEYEYLKTMEGQKSYVVLERPGPYQTVPEGFRYTTNENPWFLTIDEIRERLEAV